MLNGMDIFLFALQTEVSFTQPLNVNIPVLHSITMAGWTISLHVARMKTGKFMVYYVHEVAMAVQATPPSHRARLAWLLMGALHMCESFFELLGER